MEIEPRFTETSLVGERLTVTVDKYLESYNSLNKFVCEPNERFPDDWTIHATVPQEDSVSSGDAVEGWIFDIDTRNRKITVTTDNFGRADFHTLRDRHLKAADYVAQLVITDVADADAVELDKISHAKGLLSRCLRKDQWDWYTVYNLLGKPPKKRLSQDQQALSQLRDAAKRGDDSEVQQYINQLRRQEIATRFAYFVRRVNLGREYESVDDEYLLQKLHRLEPLVFEEFIADLWDQLGWETEVVPVEEDRGADVIATKEDVITRKRAIQVKRRNPDATHALEEVQRYMALALRDNIDEALFIITGQFTQSARKEAKSSVYELMDGADLTDFVRENGLTNVLDEYVDLE
jgi:HJR/Mrr/RecB family endonuclease